MSKYERFDQKLLKLIGDGHSTVTELVDPMCWDAAPFSLGQPIWRVIDRRLQALRKAGKIRYANGAWLAAE